MKAICFIAARGNSKGIPQKNIRKIAGKPLIAHTIENALKSNLFDHVVVSTEDKKIANIAKKFGADIPFYRPKKLAKDSSGGTEVLVHGIEKLKSLGYDFDIIVNRDCTAPFIKIKDIRGAINLLKKKKCDAVYGVYRQHLNPYFNMMEIDKHGFLELSKKSKKKIKTRQDAPKIFQLTGLFVFDQKKFLKKWGKQQTLKICPYEIRPETGLMIDTEFEFFVAEMMFKNKF